MEISSTYRLVFDPRVSGDGAVLLSSGILIDGGGELIIGSEDCKFDGIAEILLTG